MASIEIKSDITGNVWKVLKSPGDSVEADEPIVIMESMKMEIPVTSPERGVIKEILVKEEQTIAEGAVVVRVEV
ncbi:MAG: acetyl-CoA carboxylase biotin carboxyl carrier protein subunit [Betaproteobacteria bacterium]|nr:MAG: acetyl-CoA carboxylase biotin carboxyl carrier protein subunit [Betaproteobacteria bacterium]